MKRFLYDCLLIYERGKMKKKIFNLINGVLNIFFGIAWLSIAYLIFGKELCDGGEVTLPWVIPFIIAGFGFLSLGIIMLGKRNIKKRGK